MDDLRREALSIPERDHERDLRRSSSEDARSVDDATADPAAAASDDDATDEPTDTADEDDEADEDIDEDDPTDEVSRLLNFRALAERAWACAEIKADVAVDASGRSRRRRGEVAATRLARRVYEAEGSRLRRGGVASTPRRGRADAAEAPNASSFLS